MKVYSDGLSLKRLSPGYQVVGPTQDRISFSEIESITARKASRHIWGMSPGRIQILCREGTRYWQITKDVLDTENRIYNRVLANEIVYDLEYNDVVEKNVSVILDALHAYKTGRQKDTADRLNQNVHIGNMTVPGGQVVVGAGNNNNIHVDTIGSVTVTAIAERIQGEIEDTREREEMLRILKEIESAIENIQAGRPVEAADKGLKEGFEKNMEKYGSIYAAIFKLIFTAVLKKMGLA